MEKRYTVSENKEWYLDTKTHEEFGVYEALARLNALEAELSAEKSDHQYTIDRNAEVEADHEKEINALKAENAQLKARCERLEDEIKALEMQYPAEMMMDELDPLANDPGSDSWIWGWLAAFERLQQRLAALKGGE